MANDTIKVVGKDGLFDLTGVKNVEKLLKTIQELQKAVESYDDTLNKNEKELKAQSKVSKELIELNKNNEKIISEQTKIVQDLSKKYKENTAAKEDNKKKQEALSEAEKQAIKISKEKVKLRDQLKFAATDEAKEVAKLKIQILQANKANREAAKTSLQELDAYQKKSKRLNDLRKDYKKAAASEKVLTKETKALIREIEDLDTELKKIDSDVGQFQRNVGNYEKAMEGLGDAFGNVSTEVNNFSFSQEGATGGINSLLSSVGKLHPAIAVLAATAATATAAFATTERGASSLDKGIGFLKGGFNTLKDAAGGFIADLVDGKGITEAYANNIEGLTDKTIENAQAGSVNAQAQRDLNIAQGELNLGIQKLRNQYELLRQSSGDATTALNAQRDASIDASNKQIEVSEKAVQIVKNRIAINEEEIRIAGKNLDQSSELIERRKELNLDLLESQNELVQNQKELGIEQRTIDQDIFEQRLDFLIDFTDNVKAQNERILANDKLNNDERIKLLDQTTALQTKTIQDQNKLFEGIAGRQIDFAGLEAITDSDELFKQVEAIKLSEIVNNRLLESLRERRTAQQDLIDAEIALRDELIATEEITQLTTEQDRFNRAIANAENTADERERIEKEHQKNIIDIQIKSLITQLNNAEKGSLEAASVRLEIAEAQEEALRLQDKEIDNQKKINILADEHRAIEQAVGSELINQGTQLVKNQLAASVLNTALQVALTNILSNQQTFQGTGTAAGAQTLGTLRGFSSGGYTGDGGKYDVAGVVHKGEHVATAEETTRYNLKHNDLDTVVQKEALKVAEMRSFDLSNKYLTPQKVESVKMPTADEIGRATAKYMPESGIKDVGPHFVTFDKKLGNISALIHKSPKSTVDNHFVKRSLQ